MRKALLASLVLVFALALTACGGGGSTTNLDKANGDWTCDIAATMALQGDQFKDQPEALAMVEAMFSSFNLNINAKDKFGETVLHTAFEKEDSTTIKLLIEKGANTNLKDRFGNFLLHSCYIKKYWKGNGLLG